MYVSFIRVFIAMQHFICLCLSQLFSKAWVRFMIEDKKPVNFDVEIT